MTRLVLFRVAEALETKGADSIASLILDEDKRPDVQLALINVIEFGLKCRQDSSIKATRCFQVKEALASTVAASGQDGSNVPMLDSLLALKTLKELSPEATRAFGRT